MKKFILYIFLILSVSLSAETSYFANSRNTNEYQRTKGQTEAQDIYINYLNSKLTVENAPINSTVEIFSLVGNKVFTDVITDSKQYFIVELTHGYYFIKIGNTLTRKISVK